MPEDLQQIPAVLDTILPLPPLAPEIGDHIGKYHLKQKYGSGGQGIVYGAENTENGMDVAIKIIHPIHNTPEAREMLKKEAREAARLDHPYVQKVIGCETVTINGQEAMAYIQKDINGKSLAEVELTKPQQLKILTQAADGLDFVNRQNVLHKDLKPGNIMVVNSNSNNPDDYYGVLGDFGISSQVLTPQKGYVAGSLAFSSREHLTLQLKPGDSEYADFALCAFSALTGKNVAQYAGVNTDKPYEVMHYMAALHSLPPEAEKALNYLFPGTKVVDVFNKALDPQNTVSEPGQTPIAFHNASEFMAELTAAANTRRPSQ